MWLLILGQAHQLMVNIIEEVSAEMESNSVRGLYYYEENTEVALGFVIRPRTISALNGMILIWESIGV